MCGCVWTSQLQPKASVRSEQGRSGPSASGSRIPSHHDVPHATTYEAHTSTPTHCSSYFVVLFLNKYLFQTVPVIFFIFLNFFKIDYVTV